MTISRSVLQRLPLYLSALRQLPPETATISATALAARLELGDVQVRKDLASICGGGRPKTGYRVPALRTALETALGYYDRNRAVIVGAGKLGLALMEYQGFSEYGLDILAAFDTDPAKTALQLSRPVLPMEQLGPFCRAHGIRIGVVTVPAAQAQEVCGQLAGCGVRAIWNFAPTHISAGPDILIQNENMAASLAMLCQHLRERTGTEAATD